MLRDCRTVGRSRQGEQGASSPTLPAVLLIILFAFVMATVAPVNFNRLLHRLLPFLPSDKQVLSPQDAGALVWVVRQSGTYYCSESEFYGQGAGDFMRQADALERGYQPALARYCHDTTAATRPPAHPPGASRRVAPPKRPSPIPPPPDIE
jgi:hypothetical protein